MSERGNVQNRYSGVAVRLQIADELQGDIARAMRGFVAKIAELARREAVTRLDCALRLDRRAGLSWTSAQPSRRGRPVGTGRPKRTTEELESLGAQFTTFVAMNPGLRIEQINRKLGTATHELALPIRRLLVEGKIRVQGEARATRYFVTAAGWRSTGVAGAAPGEGAAQVDR